MIDLHSHILPGWDDGAKTWEEAARMCELAKEDGIQKITLTPHVFRYNKTNDELNTLSAKLIEFETRAADWGLDFYRGAEVFIHDEIVRDVWEKNLTINRSNYMFVEFPREYILSTVKDLLFKLMLQSVFPIISHPERNLVFSARPELLAELIQMGCLGQVTAKSLLGEFGRKIQKTAELFIRHNLVHVIASDAHDVDRRPPKLRQAVIAAADIVGWEKAEAMVSGIPQAILDNAPIPDYGDPENPVKTPRKLSIRIPRLR
jgi:protein-tyrosine phosphatase